MGVGALILYFSVSRPQFYSLFGQKFGYVAAAELDRVDWFEDKPVEVTRFRYHNGNNLLHFALKKDSPKTARLLLRRGMDPNETNDRGYTALHMAAMWNTPDLTRRMIDHGARINVRSRSGMTPLYFASHYGHAETVDLLLRQGADPDLATRRGFTPLHRASYRAHPEVVRLLLEHKASVDQQTKAGFTPLHEVVRGSGKLKIRRTIVKLLLDHGADATVQDPRERTALEIARQNKYSSIVQRLEDRSRD